MMNTAETVILPPAPMRQRVAAIVNILLETTLYLLPVFFLFKRSYATSIYVWIAGFFCLCLLLEKRRPRFGSPIASVTLLFLLCVFVSSILTIGVGNTWREGKHFLYGVFLFFVLVDQFRRKQYLVRRYVLLLVLLGLLVGLDTLWQFSHAGIDLFGIKTESLRMTALFSNPNYLGFFLSGIPPLCFWLYDYSERIWMRVMWAGCMYIIVLAIALSETRSALLALALFLFFMLSFRRKGHTFLFLPFLFVIPMIFFLNGKILWERFVGLAHLHGDRLLIFSDAFGWIQKHPWLGYGLDSYTKTVPALLYAGHKWPYSAPHNFFLEIWFASGLFSLLLFAYLLYLVFRDNMHSLRREGPQVYLFAAFWLLFISSFFSIPFFARRVSIYFWLYLGMVYGNVTIRWDKIPLSPRQARP